MGSTTTLFVISLTTFPSNRLPFYNICNSINRGYDSLKFRSVIPTVIKKESLENVQDC